MFAECSMSMLTRYKLLNSDLCHGLVFKMPALVQVPTTPTPCQGLYANISILEHSCINNASKHFDGDNRVVIRYCTVLNCTVLYCTVLYRTVLYCGDQGRHQHQEGGAHQHQLQRPHVGHRQQAAASRSVSDK